MVQFYNRFDIGASAGFGLEISVGNGSFLLDLRHNMDFNAYFKNDQYSDKSDRTYNTAYSASIGYLYTIN